MKEEEEEEDFNCLFSAAFHVMNVKLLNAALRVI